MRNNMVLWVALGICTASALACSQPQESVPVAKAEPVIAAPSPTDALNELDPRMPVPLLPMMAWHQKQNMQEHLVAIEQIVGALAQEDWEGVSKASALIESSPGHQRMCEHMGAGAEGFTQLALEFHSRADGIGEAARERDSKAVLQATSQTLQVCTGCHAAYRQDIVDAQTWRQRTGQSHAPSGGH